MSSSKRHETNDNPWSRYQPDETSPWDVRRVVHMHRRAGFGASWGQIERDLADGPEKSTQRLLEGKLRPVGAPEPAEFERTSALLVESAVAAREPGRLKAWWFYRMLFSPDPLGERLTLMWHTHFATSNLKVDDVALMHRQNASIRRLARAPFGELLRTALREPALLVYLDAPANRKGHPNENLAREMMELFTLGPGRFSETDVKEVARALTGWNVEDGAFREMPARHDDGLKTILGKTGNWNATDLVRIILEQPATAHRLAWRICDTLMGEGAVDLDAIRALGDSLRAHDYDVGWCVGIVLRSRAFFADRNLGTRVRSPVEFVVNPVHVLELLDPPPSTLVLADWSTRLGQDLFDPPNVGGWPGGRSWLSARSLIGRVRYASALVGAQGIGREGPLEPIALALRHGRGSSRRETLTFLSQILLGIKPEDCWIERLEQAIGGSERWNEELARRAVVQILASPEGQVG
jgi:uncharacterized protein (DUF1800 family)